MFTVIVYSEGHNTMIHHATPVLLTVLLSLSPALAAEKEFTTIFNGKDLRGVFLQIASL